MFRSHVESGILVYETFMYGPSNLTTQTPEQVSGSPAWYKSPLFDSMLQLSISEVHLELLLSNGTVAVRLTFSVEPGDRLQSRTTWFMNKGSSSDSFSLECC